VFHGGVATYLVVDESGKRKVIEKIGEESPDIRVTVLAQTLVVEPVHLGDLPRLVISAEDRDTVAVAQLQRNEQRDGLHRVVTAVDVVTHEEVVGVGRVTADAEEFGEVMLEAACLYFNSEGRWGCDARTGHGYRHRL
jgi:hypothetical protein